MKDTGSGKILDGFLDQCRIYANQGCANYGRCSALRGFLDGGWHIGYMVYHATGEGVRVCVAIAGSQEHAEKILKSRIDEYFHRAIESSPITVDGSNEVMRMLQWIPDAVKRSLGEMPPGAGEYYAELYYNLG